MKFEDISKIINSCADLRIYNVKEKKFYDEKAVIFIEKLSSRIIAVGNEAIEAATRMAGIDNKLISPFERGKIADFLPAEKMMKCFMIKYIGGRMRGLSKGHGALIIHEELTPVELKVFEDLFFGSMMFSEITIIREGVTGITPYHTWDEVAEHLVDTDPKLRVVVEIKKNHPEEYAKEELEQLLKNCEKRNVSLEQLKEWMSE